MAKQADAETVDERTAGPGFRARHRFAPTSARKARYAVDLIRGLPVNRALERLEWCPRRAASMVRKVLQSAVANAGQDADVDANRLVVADARADDGPTFKRGKARSRGQFQRAAPSGRVGFAARFHLHPAVASELDEARQIVLLRLPGGEAWMFRTGGGLLSLEDSVFFDRGAAAPLPARQVVVRSEVVEYLAQITWSFGRIAEAHPAS